MTSRPTLPRPTTVSGLINMRGQIVTAIDLRRCLGFPERPSGQPPAGLILQAEEGLVGLIVDEIGTVFELPEDAFEPPPEILKGRLRALVSRVYTLPNRLLLVMDTQRLLTEALDIGKPPDPARGRDVHDPSASAPGSSAMATGIGNRKFPTNLEVQSDTESLVKNLAVRSVDYHCRHVFVGAGSIRARGNEQEGY